MMNISNNNISLEVVDHVLLVTNHLQESPVCLEWPAVALGINGRRIVPSEAVDTPTIKDGAILQTFIIENFSFTVSLTLSNSCWFRKKVEVTSSSAMPTVDYLEVDRQQIDDSDLRVCGYRATNQPFSMEPQAEEEASGSMPGCGYPLVGGKFFIGLEHPAAVNMLDASGNYVLKHFPQWVDNKLEEVDAVFGWSDNPTADFAGYLEQIRLPRLKKPMISYCTFWSDPYIGNYEYAVKFDNYMSFFNAFFELGLRPDIFTLDAGWNDRQSIFQAKEDVKRDAGLLELRDFIRQHGTELSLWVSHNGPMGIAPEYMAQRGFATGGGNSSAYCIDGSGVLMDSAFEQALTERFCELVEKIQAVHYKIDWDNECASNPDFAEKYPTPDHVRQASLNAMFRIGRKMRKINPDIVTRNGWWVSPWMLSHFNHIWLAQSGDSEFASLPSANQRESASTHRDLMYYNILQRDKSMIPLDCFDNHEFADGLRNPFVETPLSWCNAVWLSFMRGSTYLAYTLQPEAMEKWQVESLKRITDFCRTYANNIFVANGRMVMGHPGHGEVYGFIQPGATQSWCILRNPLPIPQRVQVDFCDMVTHKAQSVKQFYPCYEYLQSDEITFLPHEIKIVVIDRAEAVPEYDVPFMVDSSKDGYEYRFPASLNFDDRIKPLIKEIYQIPQMKFSDIEKLPQENGLDILFSLTAPYRVRDFKMHIMIKGEKLDQVKIKNTVSRYKGVEGSCYVLPVTELQDNLPGFGEVRNPDSSPVESRKFFSMEIPDGGISNYRLSLIGFDPESMVYEIWASGYEAPSREALKKPETPMFFDKCLPPQNPLGFPIVVSL